MDADLRDKIQSLVWKLRYEAKLSEEAERLKGYLEILLADSVELTMEIRNVQFKEAIQWKPLQYRTGNSKWDLINYVEYLHRILWGFSPENVYCFFESDELEGIEPQKEGLIRALVEEPSKRLVISLVSMGGIGKTTLARIVYKNEYVQGQFDCKAWIDMSQVYNFEHMLQTLVKMIVPAEEDDRGDEREIILTTIPWFNKYLSTKRYVIVFDNVWQTDFLKFMNVIFRDNNNGSRIIITTRNNDIATSCDVVMQLQPLPEESACKLFFKSAFAFEFQGLSTPEKDEMAHKVVRACHGLPILVWAAADIIQTRTDAVQSEWKKVLDDFTNEIKENPYPIEEVLRTFYHTYDEMLPNLRCCLLYFSMFPKDYHIPDRKLVKLWIVEGFVGRENGKDLERVAERYLNELIKKNFVQVSYVDYYGTERMCRVHSFMHAIILAKAKRFKVCQVLANETDTLSVDGQIPRFSIHGETIKYLKNTGASFVRSVQLFNPSETTMQKSLVGNFFKRFKHLELLDFENAPIDSLPKEVGNLTLLKYLGLRNTKVKELPKSLGQLLSLQVLDVRNTLMHELPIHIQKLQKLQHVLASKKASLDSIRGIKIREGIGCLGSLQTLMTVDAHASSFNVIEELERLTQLRWLSISKLTEEIMNTLCSAIEKMVHLESLSLFSFTDSETLHLESISTPPPLVRLILKGRLKKLPSWILMLENLSTLGLSYSQLAADPLKELQFLPNLKFLWLYRAYEGKELHFEEVSFQKLKQLVLTELHDLRAIKIEKGALPLLEELKLGNTVNDLSIDIQNLRNLQVLECYDMPDEFVLRFQPEGGSDYWKIKHVPNVIFRFRVRGNHYASFKLGEAGLFNHVKGLSRSTSNVELYSRQLSFFCNDDEELARTSNAEWSDQYSFFTDDVES